MRPRIYLAVRQCLSNPELNIAVISTDEETFNEHLRSYRDDDPEFPVHCYVLDNIVLDRFWAQGFNEIEQ